MLNEEKGKEIENYIYMSGLRERKEKKAVIKCRLRKKKGKNYLDRAKTKRKRVWTEEKGRRKGPMIEHALRKGIKSEDQWKNVDWEERKRQSIVRVWLGGEREKKGRE